ncbi:MAG: 16S rRNA processing protein RimM [Bacteroidetes bacterium]|nr:16S rRNA processing protein RimM [Bacteroidota bacterium]
MKEIGKIVSAHGVDGDLIISHNIVNLQSIAKLTNLLIEVWNQSYIPYFIEEIQGITKSNLCVKFEEVNSREEGKKFLNKKVYVFDEHAVQTEGKDEWAYLIGYQIISEQNTPIGTISDIYINGPQVLIELSYKNKPIQLPVHQQLILDVNKDQKTIQLIIADGLLNIWD